MISTRVVIATTSAKRWFDLDAVREPYKGHARTAQGVDRKANTTKQAPDGNRQSLDTVADNGAGAPPLDWHADGDLGAGHIVLVDHWAHSTGVLLEGGELARKVVLSACPWAVCRVCGRARERIVGVSYVDAKGNPAPGGQWASGVSTGKGAHSLKTETRTTTTTTTLGWSDCGHDNYRPGIVFDPYAAPGVAAFLYRESETSVSVRYVVADTREFTATMADGSVDLIFTSPPFLALRSYLPADHADKHREIGSEANPAAFLDTLLALTAEWRRVLAPHGTLAVELGDTYSGSGGAGGDYTNADGFHEGQNTFRQQRGSGWPLAKSLACVPDLYKTALAYGVNPLTGQPSPAGRWRVRNDITWLRPNPPVGALGDKWRPASSRIIAACTGARRWFDLDAVRHEHIGGPHAVGSAMVNGQPRGDTGGESNPAGAPPLDWHTDGDLGVGHIVLSTQPFSGWVENVRRVRVPSDEHADGSQRTTSPDCPVHGLPGRPGSNAPDGGRVADESSRSGHSESHPALALELDSPPTLSSTDPTGSTGSPASLVATARSKTSSRTARAPETTSPDTPSARTSARIDGTTATPASSAPDANTDESRTPAAPSQHSAPAQTADHNGDTQAHSACTCSWFIETSISERTSHYATFPMELPRKIIDCMCPRQVCRTCGVARERVTSDPRYVKPDGTDHPGARRANLTDHSQDAERGMKRVPLGIRIGDVYRASHTLGWSDCGHDNYRPGIVFDPFAGTGTTLAAAQDLGRDGIGCDLDPRNAWLARERVGMFLEVADGPS